MAERKKGKFIVPDLYVDDDTSIEDQISAQISSEAAAGLNWTTSEQDTGLTYAGDAVYQKTVVVGDLTGGVSKDVAHGITGLKRIIRFEGGMEDGQAGASQVFYPLPFASPSANIGVQIQATATEVKLFAGSYWNRSTGDRELNAAVVTLLYTKA